MPSPGWDSSLFSACLPWGKARGAAARGPGRGASGGKEGAGPPGSTPRVPLTLGDGDGLEAMQLLEQAAPLAGVQAVDEVARALRRVQRLYGLLLGVCRAK